MANTLFTNVRIIDGSGAPPFAGDVLVQGNRILRVGRGARVEILPRCGHWTTIEKPSECNDALKRFYARRL